MKSKATVRFGGVSGRTAPGAADPNKMSTTTTAAASPPRVLSRQKTSSPTGGNKPSPAAAGRVRSSTEVTNRPKSLSDEESGKDDEKTFEFEGTFERLGKSGRSWNTRY